jgi:peroxiredoxin
MNRFFLPVIAAVLALSSGPQLFSAETNVMTGNAAPAATNAPTDPVLNELKDLVSRINDKIKQDKTNETDLAGNLAEFEAVVDRHKDAPRAELAQVLAMKAQLYLQVLDEPEKALEVFKEIKTRFPVAEINGNTDEVIGTLQAMIEREKIHAGLEPGKPFPDFSEADVEGKPLSISKFKGKVVLVDFWATWCMPCVLELPEIQKAYEKFHDKGFEVVGVSLDEDKSRLQQFVKQKKMPWPEFFDGKKWENKLAVKYGVDSTPTGYLLDRDGKIILKVSNPEELEAFVAKAVEK